jgi:hypothetical protein
MMTSVCGDVVSSGLHGAGKRANCDCSSSMSVSLPDVSVGVRYVRLVLIRIV